MTRACSVWRATVALLLLTAMTAAAAHAAVNWTDGTGFWDVATNWSSNPALPGATDDVTINVAGVQTITHRSGTDTVQSIAITDNNLAVTGGSLTVSGAFGNTGNTSISGGTLTLNGVSTLNTLALSGNGTLAGTGAVTLSGALTWTSGGMTGTGTTNANGGITL